MCSTVEPHCVRRSRSRGAASARSRRVRVFLLIVLGKIGLTMLFGWEAGETVFDTSTTPLTILVIERLADTPLVAITYLLIAVFAGELIWKDREHDMAEIADAAPVSEGATLTGRFLALVAILAMLQLPGADRRNAGAGVPGIHELRDRSLSAHPVRHAAVGHRAPFGARGL